MTYQSAKATAKERLNEKFASYTDINSAKEWFKNNPYLIKELFDNVRIRDFIFEPFKDVFRIDASIRIKTYCSSP